MLDFIIQGAWFNNLVQDNTNTAINGDFNGSDIKEGGGKGR